MEKDKIRSGDWVGEVTPIHTSKLVILRRTPTYGQPFSAVAVGTITPDGVALIEGLLSQTHQKFTRQDYKAIISILNQAGGSLPKYTRYKVDTIT